ncbi:MAG TPA: four helix bundle protein [Terriglobia bacterium]|nr:four helix bundle protein [Terriglobia bacterium]
MGSKTYRDLELWQTAMDLVVECYQAARRFPRYETFGLSGHFRRAVVSVPANIAEGHGRQHRPEFIPHLHIALGSRAEVETHVQIAQRLGYLEPTHAEKVLPRTGEVGRLLNGMLRYLRSKPSSATGSLRRPADNRPPTTDNRKPL